MATPRAYRGMPVCNINVLVWYHLHVGSKRKSWKRRKMATRQQRIDAFDHQGTPPLDQSLEILCEDHVGTYVIPFLCQWSDGTWQKRSILSEVRWRTSPKNRAQNNLERPYPKKPIQAALTITARAIPIGGQELRNRASKALVGASDTVPTAIEPVFVMLMIDPLPESAFGRR